MQIRTPAVAGMFYSDKKNELKESIKRSFLHQFGPGKTPPSTDGKKIYGVICPHAGYMYSGPIACNSIYAISNSQIDLFVIIGPNHWGIGNDIATMKDCFWQTPIGKVEVDNDAVSEIREETDQVEIDSFAHLREHSLEVQVPILQETFHDFKILPITLINQSMDAAMSLGKAIAQIAKKRNLMIIGSSDFTHYEPNDIAHSKDKMLIEPILKLDIKNFYSVLERERISACGYGAIATCMIAAKEMGATKGELLKYATSGDITGDKTSVVGYGSIIFT